MEQVNGTNVGSSNTYASLPARSYVIVARDDQGCVSNTVVETLINPEGII